MIYVYQAAFLCEVCGEGQRMYQKMEDTSPEDIKDENSYDSDDFPKGPYEASESDSPDHCDECNVFLENPLTAYGREELYRMVASALYNGSMNEYMLEWIEFYDLDLREMIDVLCHKDKNSY